MSNVGDYLAASQRFVETLICNASAERVLAGERSKVVGLRDEALGQLHELMTRFRQARESAWQDARARGVTNGLELLSITERGGLSKIVDVTVSKLERMLARPWSTERPAENLPKGFYGEGFPEAVGRHARAALTSPWSFAEMLRLFHRGTADDVMRVVHEVVVVRKLALDGLRSLPAKADDLLAWRRAGSTAALGPFTAVCEALHARLDLALRDEQCYLSLDLAATSDQSHPSGIEEVPGPLGHGPRRTRQRHELPSSKTTVATDALSRKLMERGLSEPQRERVQAAIKSLTLDGREWLPQADLRKVLGVPYQSLAKHLHSHSGKDAKRGGLGQGPVCYSATAVRAYLEEWWSPVCK